MTIGENETITTILRGVLTREGWPTYTEHPHDRGGPTKGGITLRTLEAARGRRCNRQELRRLTEEEALQILRKNYTSQQGIYRLIDLPILAQVIDSAVLSGCVHAAKDLQTAVGAVADGIIGPRTMAKVHACDPSALAVSVAVARAKRLCGFVAANRERFKEAVAAVEKIDDLRTLVRKDKDQSVFLKGWMNRVLQFALDAQDNHAEEAKD
jgi:lysozyme family protein